MPQEMNNQQRQTTNPGTPQGAVASGAGAPRPRAHTDAKQGDQKPDKRASRQDDKPEAKKSNKRAIVVVILCVLIAVALWILIWFFACGGSSLFDTSAKDGQAPYKTQEEMQAELNRIVEEGMFNISIASSIEFADGSSTGTAYIENVPGNPYNMQVVIVDDESGETMYTSGILKPNQYIEKIALTRDFDAGTYQTTATFSALDPTSNQEVGRAAAKVQITINN